jgi:hypothetical protein
MYYDDDRIDRSDWKTVSDAAQKRCDEAIKIFDDHAAKHKNDDSKEYVRILEPNLHLTGETWKLFRKHTLDAGFEAKRVKATDDEKKAIKEKRKSAVYFVEVRKKQEGKEKKEKVEKKRPVPSEKPKRSKRTKKDDSDDEE